MKNELIKIELVSDTTTLSDFAHVTESDTRNSGRLLELPTVLIHERVVKEIFPVTDAELTCLVDFGMLPAPCQEHPMYWNYEDVRRAYDEIRSEDNVKGLLLAIQNSLSDH